MQRGLVNAAALALAYYLGALLGFALRFPSATPSVLWPPNSILTAALLLAPPARWVPLLLAVFPAHLLVELPMGLPAPLVLAWYVTNCSEGLLSAGLVRLLSDQPTRFDTLRRVAALLAGAVFLSPLLTSFLDAGAVAWLRGEPFWDVWRTRFASNALTAAVLVPLLVISAREGAGWLRRAAWPRVLEVAALASSIAAVAFTVSGGPHHWAGAIPLMALLLPLFIWAALRFGQAGVAYSVAATAVLLLRVSTHGRGPFADLAPADGALALQVTLLVVSLSLLGLTALIQERRAAEHTLAGRLRFEELLSGVARAFADARGHEMEPALQRSVEKTGEFFGLERVELRLLGPDAQAAETAHAWTAPGAPAQAARPVRPDERGTCLLRLSAGGGVLGELALRAAAGGPELDEESLWQLRMVGDVLSGALARREMSAAARRAELEAQSSRNELAHFLRVSTMGELTTSLAHELNQPLTAILANAHAARRLLQRGQENGELLEILTDIVEEDKRAGEVIKRLRELLRKGGPERALLNLNALVQDVVKLVANDAVIRGVRVQLDLSPELLQASGDRIQIQQVLLNLILNAMEAITTAGDRTVLVRTARENGRAEISVADNGSGLPPADDVFRPFYTTKPGGMGMGLAIARSIVEAHHGTLCARNNPGRGATFTFSLPAAVPHAH